MRFLSLVEATPDITLAGIRQELAAAWVGMATLRRFFNRGSIIDRPIDRLAFKTYIARVLVWGCAPVMSLS